MPGSYSIDMCAFRDPNDHQVYVYFGGLWGGQLQRYKDNIHLETPHLPEGDEEALPARCVRLTPDGMAFAEAPRPIVVVDADRRKLDNMSVTHSHQGVIALVGVNEYCSVEDILAVAEKKGEAPFVIVCDEVSDPRNLGAIIRSAECAGAHGVIIPKRRSAGLTAIVGKASAGAAEHMAIARVPNIPAVLKELKDKGLWVYGAAAGGSNGLWDTDFTGAMALVIGSEGDGIGRLVRENCDFIVNIPMVGKINSLNASAAASVIMYEVLRQRSGR